MTDDSTPAVATLEPADATPEAAVDEAPSGASDAGAPTDEERLDADLEAIWDRHNPPRDAAGRFAGAETAAVDSPTSQPEADQLRPDADDDNAAAPPSAWSAEMKTRFAALPPDVRAYIAQRESDAHGAISRYGDQLAGYRPLGELLSQNREVFERHGADAVTGIQALIQAQRRLDQNPREAIAAIAEAYGVDLAATFGDRRTQDDEDAAEPAVATLREEIAAIASRLDRRDDAERAIIQNQERQSQAASLEELRQWSVDKPHFQAVRTAMGGLIASGAASSLDQAYEMACNASPDIRPQIQAAASKAAEEQRRREAARHTADAKRAAGLRVGSGRQGVTAPSGNWDDDSYLAAVYDRAAGQS